MGLLAGVVFSALPAKSALHLRQRGVAGYPARIAARLAAGAVPEPMVLDDFSWRRNCPWRGGRRWPQPLGFRQHLPAGLDGTGAGLYCGALGFPRSRMAARVDGWNVVRFPCRDRPAVRRPELRLRPLVHARTHAG